MLKDRVGMARTYIRPVQRDLDLSAIFQLPKGVNILNVVLYIMLVLIYIQ